MNLRQATTVLAATLALAACGDSSTGNDGVKTMSALVDGASWTLLPSTLIATATAPGKFYIEGANSKAGNPFTIKITLFNITEPGLYPMGVTPSVTGGYADVGSVAGGYATLPTGTAGTITVATVSSTRISGSFSFRAGIASAANGKTITNGVFDVPVTATGDITVPEKNGGSFIGSLASVPFTATTLAVPSKPSTGTLDISAVNSTTLVDIVLSGFTGVGTYNLNTGTARYIAVNSLDQSKVWGGSNALSSGTVIVTSATAGRIKGTYNATLTQATATAGAPTVSFAGSFDVGIP